MKLKPFVFIDGAFRPYRVQEWCGELWVFYWHKDNKWVSLRKVENNMDLVLMQRQAISDSQASMYDEPHEDLRQLQNNGMKKDPGPEKHFHAACEKYLYIRGYWPRDNKNILEVTGKAQRGFYLHINRAQGNPLVLDFLIVDNQWHAIEVELKCEKGKVSPIQQVLLDRGGFLVWNLDDFIALMYRWEGRGYAGKV